MNNKHMRIGAVVAASVLILLCGIIFLVVSSGLLPNSQKQEPGITMITQEAIEADLEILETEIEQDWPAVRAFFVELAQQNGGVYAFEVLKYATLPSGTDIHLLGHAVGDELYKQEGLDGMQYCTHDFRNACSHSIVVGALLAEGMDVFDKVNESCKKAPGGSGAYTMCFHGFGHGVLAYTGYEVPDAVRLCGKVGTEAYNMEEEAQCIGGIVMEMNQGIHDPEIWAQKKDKYLSIDDPLRLCKAEYMPEVAKILCYSYITPYIFDSAGAVNGNPTPDIYPQSFAYCDEVENDAHRESCYGGLGKEFIVLGQDRDIRRIEDTTNKTLELVASWCALASKQEAEVSCLLSILDSLFWGGENDPEVSVRYCSLLTESSVTDDCFAHLFMIAAYYQKDQTIRDAICKLVPGSYKDQCRDSLASS